MAQGAGLPPPKQAARCFLSAAVRGVVGPALGGVLGDVNDRLPFFVAAGMVAANVVYGYFVLPETLDPENRRPFSLRRSHVVGSLRRMLQYPIVRGLLLALIFFNISQDANLATWTFVTMDKFEWTALDIGLSMTFIGVWIEKGMGLVVPGFIPSPLHEIVEYQPSMTEWRVTAGIWAFGLLVYSAAIKVAIPILTGEVRHRDAVVDNTSD